MKQRSILYIFILSTVITKSFAQGQLSGDFMMNTNFYIRDTVIGANTTQYQHEKSSSEAWLYLNYQISGYTFAVRYDLFNNSPLLNPNEAYTASGLGLYSINKKFDNFDITAGTFYDQFGSGILFRAYEDRLLGLDYAVEGIDIKYNLNENIMIKGFTGLQKFRFGQEPEVLKGLNLEKNWNFSEKFHMVSGAAYLNRTIDQNTMQNIATDINSYPLQDRFIPKYNVYSASIYNTLNYRNLSFYIEYAYKTDEAIWNRANSLLVDKDGDILFTTLNYSVKGFGISLQRKKSNQFELLTSPLVSQPNEGVIGFMPPMSKEVSEALPARYNISSLPYGEDAYQGEVTVSPNKENTFLINYSYIMNDAEVKTYSDLYFDYYRRFNKNLKTNIGVQWSNYNKLVYQGHLEPNINGTQEDSIVKAITPFFEISYKLTPKKSFRMELQYMFTKQDYGDFFFGLLEYNIAPTWSFSVSDMINTQPTKNVDIIHYPSVAVAYTLNQTHITLAYMKHVAGIVCTGGVCRLEPAFSGIKLSFTTSF